MGQSWRPKPGNKVVRPRRVKPFRLRRVLGIPGLFSIGYGDVGSSIYYALGAIALVALGATPIALVVAGVIYIFNALTYAEGSAMISEGGGSNSYARLAFNDMVGFGSGWALMLTYAVTVAIAAFAIPPYLSYFWPVLSQPAAGTAASIGIIFFLMIMNVVGVGEWSGINIFFVSVDILAQLVLVVLGIVLILGPNPAILFRNMFSSGNWPSAGNLIFGIAIAALCFTGVESVAQHSEETRRPERKVVQTYILMVVTVLVLFAGISLVALSAMTPQELGDPVNGWGRHPVAGIASAVSSAIQPDQIVGHIESQSARNFFLKVVTGFRDVLPGLISVVASLILLMATNTGMLGISRLTYNMSRRRQLPATLSRIHDRFRTPYLAIMIFSFVSILMLLPGLTLTNLFAELAALYVFGLLLVFASAHASILRLRMTKPHLPRPFRVLGNLKYRGYEFPVTALLGLASTSIIWLIVVIIQPYSWWIGLAWLVSGFILYYLYRKSQGMPLLHLPPPSTGRETDGEGR